MAENVKKVEKTRKVKNEGTPGEKGKISEGVSRKKGIPVSGKNEEEKKVVKPRGRNGAGTASVRKYTKDLPESDISRIVRESFQYFGRKPPKDNQECADRLNEYFRQCNAEGQMPTVEDMCLALGSTRQRVWEWENAVSANPERADMIKRAKEIIAAIDGKLAAEGKIPQVVYIFRAKNFHGMKDQQDVVVTPNVDPLGDRRTGEALADKYIDSLKGAEEPQKEAQKGRRLLSLDESVVDAEEVLPDHRILEVEASLVDPSTAGGD